MKAIILTFDKNSILTEHMIACYDELWPDHPFIFRIPYQNSERCVPSDKREYVQTPTDIKVTVLSLLKDLEDEEWIYWCIDDKYPIQLTTDHIKPLYESILNNDVQDINSILFCRARKMLDPKNLTDLKIMLGKEQLLERNSYQMIWIHQFVQVKVLRYMFNRFPDPIPRAKLMDELKDRLIKPAAHKLFVTETNYAIFGESTIAGLLTENCLKSLSDKGFALPKWHLSQTAKNTIIGTI